MIDGLGGSMWDEEQCAKAIALIEELKKPHKREQDFQELVCQYEAFIDRVNKTKKKPDIYDSVYYEEVGKD